MQTEAMMANISLLSSYSPYRIRTPVLVSPGVHHSNRISWQTLAFRSSPLRNKTLRIIHCSKFSDEPSKESSSSRFLNENGVVEDMDGYLNYLSLEYDSVWDTKPSWCQPWTITLTGVSAIVGSWLILHLVPATLAVSFLIGTWWYIFLYSYPKAYKEMIAERRKKVKSGVEDTFGLRNSP